MHRDIVEIETKDKLPLFGILSRADKSKTILINIHGTASNFYENRFMSQIETALMRESISTLSTNNRGAAVMQVYPHAGAALEHFEDCVLDIDAWIEFALSNGYNSAILQGHSLGTEKVVYYMNKGKNVNKIKAIILLAPADSYGYTKEVCLDNKTFNELIKEAKSLKNKERFLTARWLCHGEVLPKGADSFLNFFQEGSELSKALPLRQGKNLKMYQEIKVPILVSIGDQKEYTVIPIKEALTVLKKENPRTRCIQLKNCNHDFEGKEEELSKVITDFIKESL